MRATLSKAEIESDISSRFENAFKLQEKKSVATLATGVADVDSLTGGLPRGAITEIYGPASSGRTSLLFSLLAYATTHDEICALVDTNDVFAPTSAVLSGIDLDRMLWIRCAANLEHAFKATDLLLHAGGFGLVILDLGDVAGKDVRRIISSWWYRFRRTVESKPTAIVVISAESCTRSCSLLTLELKGCAEWVTTKNVGHDNVVSINKESPLKLIPHANLLRVNSVEVNRRRPVTADLNQTEFKSFFSTRHGT